MKITKSYLKQIIKEELELYEAEKPDLPKLREPSKEEEIAQLEMALKRLGDDPNLEFKRRPIKEKIKALKNKK
jgi:hypothetical protein